MNIVNILLTNRNGGLEQAFYDYSLLLHQLGHQVIAIVREDAPYIDKISEIGVKIVKIKNNFGYIDLLAIKNLKNIFNEFDIDVVFSHAGRSTQLCRKAIKRIKQKKIFHRPPPKYLIGNLLKHESSLNILLIHLMKQ